MEFQILDFESHSSIHISKNDLVILYRISIWVIIDGCSLDSSLHTKPAGGGASNPDGGRRKNDSEWSGTCCWGCFFQWFRHKTNPYPCNPGSKCNCK